MAAKPDIHFAIETEITPASFDDLTRFIHQHYILPHPERFSNARRTSDLLSFTVLGPEEKWHVDVQIKTGKPIEVDMVSSSETVPQALLEQLKEDPFTGAQFFEEKLETPENVKHPFIQSVRDNTKGFLDAIG